MSEAGKVTAETFAEVMAGLDVFSIVNVQLHRVGTMMAVMDKRNFICVALAQLDALSRYNDLLRSAVIDAAVHEGIQFSDEEIRQGATDILGEYKQIWSRKEQEVLAYIAHQKRLIAGQGGKYYGGS